MIRGLSDLYEFNSRIQRGKRSLSHPNSSYIPLLDNLPYDQLATFCRRWRISELALFGSALRPDFTPDSDLDFLAAFDEGAEWSLFDHVKMQHELEALLGRKVDLVSKRAVEHSMNRIRRDAILSTARTLVAAPVG